MIIQNNSTLTMQMQTASGETVDIERKSNTTSTSNLTVLFDKTISSAFDYIIENEQLEITVTLTNNSDIAVTDLTLKGVLSSDLVFEAGSVVIDGTSSPTADIVTGVTLTNLAPTEIHTVKFESTTAQVQSTAATVFGTVNYKVNDPIEGQKDVEEDTSTLNIEIVVADITIENTVNKGYAIKGETLHYTTTITNGTTSQKTQVFFVNPIPTGTTFVAESVKVDDTPQPTYDPVTGFSLGTLATSGTSKVEFDVTVD